MSSTAGIANMSNPPSIPGARERTFGHPGHTLIWVRTGRARLLLDDGTQVHLAGGEGVWIPANGWDYREIVTEPGTVAFPFWPDASVGTGTVVAPTRFEVPESWEDWLIQYFNLQVTPLDGNGYSSDGLVRLLDNPSPDSSSSARDEDSRSPLLDSPAMPKSSGARAIAEELTRDPAIDLTVHEWARRVLSSPRTLLRDFIAETGLTFEQWRQQRRLSAAIDLLVAGYEVDYVATRVGFSSRGGFTNAFKRQTGSTPHQFMRELSASSAGPSSPGRAVAARQANDLVRLVRGGATSSAAPDLLPAARTPRHANDIHVLSWMYRGNGYLDMGERRYDRDRGVATWIPAGAEHITGLRPDSISLPLGNATTGDLHLTEPMQVQFSPAWDEYLMFCSISARSGLQPDNYDPRDILDLFADQVAAQRALSVPMPTDPLARASAMDYLRSIGSSGTSDLDLSDDIHRAFREQTGMTFTRWRYAARMRIARDLLAGGAKSSAVARRVGYGHLPNFSAAFTRFHGLSPRDYQERETDKV